MRGSAGGRSAPIVVLVAALGLSSCATTAVHHREGDPVISASELASTSTLNLYDAIGLLRPAWPGFAGAGHEGDSALPVYMNRLYLGGSEALTRVRVLDVAEVRFVPPVVALDRYGTRHPAGAIEVVTRDVGAY